MSRASSIIGANALMRVRRRGGVSSRPVSDATLRMVDAWERKGVPLRRRAASVARRVNAAGVPMTARAVSKALRLGNTGVLRVGGSVGTAKRVGAAGMRKMSRMSVGQAASGPGFFVPRSMPIGKTVYAEYGLSGGDELGKFKLKKVFKKITKGVGKIASAAVPIVANVIAPGSGALVQSVSGTPGSLAATGSVWGDILAAGKDVLGDILRRGAGGSTSTGTAPAATGVSRGVSVGVIAAIAAGGVGLYLLTRRR